MSNLEGVEVHRIQAGAYLVNGYRVETVKGTSGWRITAEPGLPPRWAKTLWAAKTWIARQPRQAR